jgi:hypothetical protein
MWLNLHQDPPSKTLISVVAEVWGLIGREELRSIMVQLVSTKQQLTP